VTDFGAAVDALLRRLDAPPAAVGHRVVHGGARFVEPTPLTAEVVDALEKLVPLAPDHQPQALEAIRAVWRAYPELPQVACFDTAFHRRLTAAAQTYALPADVREAGVVRYGFHGLSYEYVVGELRRVDPTAAGGRVIVAHLGHGASLAAIRGGVGVDTTMGFTPAGGLVMGTRSGDLDPGVLTFLARERGLGAAELDELVNYRSGLLGLSGTSSDMSDLLSREAEDEAAALAVEVFCYRARLFVGALAAALGGLDTLVFTAGIGERAAPVRARICAGLEHLGVELNPSENDRPAAVISSDGSRVTVRVIPTDEDRMIARHTAATLE
jgi:acetate kinase